MPDHQKPDPSVPETQRVVRVFISSTFRDMHAERDELMIFIFPELRRRCRERQVEFIEVDLRWGITEEESKQGKVLPICLKEIERSKPYFIGLLGERYGWVPDTIPQEVIDQEPWLKEHIGKTGKSVTELEILHGVLNNPEIAAHAFFYFRDPAYIESISAEKKKDFTAEGAEDAEKLLQLKEKIRKSGMPVIENYPNPKKLGELILEDLWKVIDKKFPLKDVPTALERERMDHEAFAMARQKVYISRDLYFKRLDEHVVSANPPLVILGESGSGKSALIANWIKKHKEEHPDDFMVTHFIGGTADSADYVKILRRIMEEIKERYEPAIERNIPSPLVGEGQGEGVIPTDPKKVVEVFPLWLAKIRGRCILVLDALNQLEDKDNAPDLGWLPGFFPENMRVILSTLTVKTGKGFTAEGAEKQAEKERDLTATNAEGAKKQAWRRPLEALKRRGWQVLNVELLDGGERRVFVEKYLARFSRKLSPKNMDTIVTAQQTSNPLYLKALLDELRVFGFHEELGNKIGDYLKAETVDDLYEKVLERLERDYEQGRKGLVREAMSLLWASRRGLSETELLELLGKDKEPMPRAYWSPLYLALEESLVSRSGLLTFFHDYLRKAVEDRYFYDPKKKCLDAGKKRQEHLRLADYFEKRKTDDRKADELPWQLREAHEWERLKDCIKDMNMFLRLVTDVKEYDLMGYWLAMGDRFNMVEEYNSILEVYQKLIPNHDAFAYMLLEVAKFLHLSSEYAGSEPLYRRALAINEKDSGNENLATQTIINNLAVLLDDKGDYAGAESLQRRALAISEKLLGREHPTTATSINNLAKLLESKGDYAGAEPLYRRALAINEKVLGQEHPSTATILDNLAALINKKGDYKDAEPLVRRALKLREQLMGSENPQTATSLINLGLLLYNKGDYAGAEPLYRRALGIYERKLGSDHPYTAQSINNLALLLKKKGDYARAKPLYRRALGICERAKGSDHPQTAECLNNMALLLEATNRLSEAEPLMRRGVEILLKFTRETGHQHSNLRGALDNYAGLLQAMGRSTEDIRNTIEKMGKRFGVDLWGTGGQTGSDPLPKLHAVLEQLMQDPSKAQDIVAKLQREDPALFEELIQFIQQQEQQTQQKAYEELAAMEKTLGQEHPDTIAGVQNLANILYNKGDYAGAEPLYRRALAIMEKTLGQEHQDTATSRDNLITLLENKAELFNSKRDHATAESAYREALQIREKALGNDHPDTALSNNQLGVFLRNIGRPEDAEKYQRRALEIDEKVRKPDDPKISHRLNNLAIVLTMQGKVDKAKRLLARAWKLKTSAHDITSIRVLFSRIATAMMGNEPYGVYLGQMKALFGLPELAYGANVSTTWDIEPVIKYIQPKISPEEDELLFSIGLATNDRSKLPELDRFPVWKDQTAVPLDVSW